MTNKFDERLKLWGDHIPSSFRDALVEVADTLDFAATIAETHLGDKWTGADAIAICQMVLARREQIANPPKEPEED